MTYYFSKIVNLPFEQAEKRVTEELKKEGFGIMTTIDVRETIKTKLNVDFRQYKILGACNPPFAYKTLQAEDKAGLMMPCNVIVQELGEGKTEVAAIDPLASMQAIGNPKLADTAKEVSTRLKKVIESV